MKRSLAERLYRSHIKRKYKHISGVGRDPLNSTQWGDGFRYKKLRQQTPKLAKIFADLDAAQILSVYADRIAYMRKLMDVGVAAYRSQVFNPLAQYARELAHMTSLLDEAYATAIQHQNHMTSPEVVYVNSRLRTSETTHIRWSTWCSRWQATVEAIETLRNQHNESLKAVAGVELPYTSENTPHRSYPWNACLQHPAILRVWDALQK